LTEIPTLWQSEEFSSSASASTFRNNIKGYFSSNFGSDISVSREMFDEAGLTTEDQNLATTYTYTITMKKVINGFSTNAVSVKKVSTESTFNIVAPNKGGTQSSTPISGYYTITC
jgi:hypothetical protein